MGRVQLGDAGHIAKGYSSENASNDSKEATIQLDCVEASHLYPHVKFTSEEYLGQYV